MVWFGGRRRVISSSVVRGRPLPLVCCVLSSWKGLARKKDASSCVFSSFHRLFFSFFKRGEYEDFLYFLGGGKLFAGKMFPARFGAGTPPQPRGWAMNPGLRGRARLAEGTGPDLHLMALPPSVIRLGISLGGYGAPFRVIADEGLLDRPRCVAPHSFIAAGPVCRPLFKQRRQWPTW